jgi:hypothetical protein
VITAEETIVGPEPTMGLCGEPNCEEYWIECAVCGCEFCTKCYPNSRFCPDCAAMGEADEEEEEESDFEDAANLKEYLEEDEEEKD